MLLFILLDTLTKLSCHLVIIYYKMEQEWNRHVDPKITCPPQFSPPFPTHLSPELFTRSEVTLLHHNLLFLLLWASEQATGWGSNRFLFFSSFFYFQKFLCVWFLPTTVRGALGRQIMGWSVLSATVSSVSFFRLPGVSSCSGLLSYFQINYFHDTYSHYLLWEIPLLAVRVLPVDGHFQWTVHFHRHFQKRDNQGSVWDPL